MAGCADPQEDPWTAPPPPPPVLPRVAAADPAEILRRLLGGRTGLGTSPPRADPVVDPVRLPAGYERQFEERVAAEPVLRAFRSSPEHLAAVASPTQVTRLRYQLPVMFFPCMA